MPLERTVAAAVGALPAVLEETGTADTTDCASLLSRSNHSSQRYSEDSENLAVHADCRTWLRRRLFDCQIVVKTDFDCRLSVLTEQSPARDLVDLIAMRFSSMSVSASVRVFEISAFLPAETRTVHSISQAGRHPRGGQMRVGFSRGSQTRRSHPPSCPDCGW